MWEGIFSFLIVTTNSLAFAASTPKLKNFTPGIYSLTEGEEEFCKAGEFKLTEDGSRVVFGPHYVFFTKDTVLKGKSDFVIEKGCEETTSYTMATKGKSTVLKSVDVVRCKGEVRQTITNEATISKGKVALTQSHELSSKNSDKAAGSPHSCVWKISKK